MVGRGGREVGRGRRLFAIESVKVSRGEEIEGEIPTGRSTPQRTLQRTG